MTHPPFQKKAVYTAINAVMRALGTDGIGKTRENTDAGFKFRGIDDLYNGLSTPLVDAGLMILPRLVARDATERTSLSGEAMLGVAVTVEYDLVAMDDGSSHTVRVVGEGLDSGDKATSKAMTAAFKVMAIQTFNIPTHSESPDPDATSPAVATSKPGARASKKPAAKKAAAKPAATPLGPAVTEYLKRIEAATTSKALNEIKAEARQACTAARDPAAYERITEAARMRAQQLVNNQ